MGSYLSTPKKKITINDGEDNQFIYCTAEMQGWRQTQEDAHVALLKYDDQGASFFAVFDGHGGPDVAQYSAVYLPNFIKSNDFYGQGEIVKALEDAFIKFDATLTEPKVLEELKKLADGDEDDDLVDEADLLKKEAQLPIEEILKNGKEVTIPIEGVAGKQDAGDVEEENKAQAEVVEKKANGEDKTDNGKSVEEAQVEETTAQSSSKLPSSPFKSPIASLFKAFLADWESIDDEEEEDESDSADEDEDEEGDDEGGDEDDEEDDCDEADSDEDEHAPFSDMFKPTSPGVDSGCTANVAIVRDGILYVSNVGDSRCILSSDGKAIEMSVDHKPEDDLERQRIIKAGGEINKEGRVNNGLNLSRALGDHSYKTNEDLPAKEQMISAFPDVKTHKIDHEKDEFIFLACDGIWNSMSSQEVVDFVHEKLKHGFKPDEICKALFHHCLAPNTDGDGSGCDNMTCILILLKNKFKQLGKRSLDESLASDADAGPSGSKKIKISDQDLCQAGPSK